MFNIFSHQEDKNQNCFEDPYRTPPHLLSRILQPQHLAWTQIVYLRSLAPCFLHSAPLSFCCLSKRSFPHPPSFLEDLKPICLLPETWQSPTQSHLIPGTLRQMCMACTQIDYLSSLLHPSPFQLLAAPLTSSPCIGPTFCAQVQSGESPEPTLIDTLLNPRLSMGHTF